MNVVQNVQTAVVTDIRYKEDKKKLGGGVKMREYVGAERASLCVTVICKEWFTCRSFGSDLCQGGCPQFSKEWFPILLVYTMSVEQIETQEKMMQEFYEYIERTPELSIDEHAEYATKNIYPKYKKILTKKQPPKA